MVQKDKKEMVSQSAEIALSAVSSLVGIAIGGVPGAVVSGILSPTSKLAGKVGQLWLQRRRERTINIVEQAFKWSGKTEEAILQEMIDRPDWCDDIMAMIQQLADADPELDAFFSKIMASAINASNEEERNRLIVLSNSIKGMNKVQLLILKELYAKRGILSAHDMAECVMVPEFELRNAVRDLELRGMICDNNRELTVWKLRELGIAVAKSVKAIDVMEVEQ